MCPSNFLCCVLFLDILKSTIEKWNFQNDQTQVEQKIQILTKQNDNEILSSFSESHES